MFHQTGNHDQTFNIDDMGVIVINNSYQNVEDIIAGRGLSNIEGESLKQNDTNGVSNFKDDNEERITSY